MKNISFYKDIVGKRAYEVHKVWRLGFHVFLCGEDLIFRVCYLRNNKGTHYAQLSIKVKEVWECENGG